MHTSATCLRPLILLIRSSPFFFSGWSMKSCQTGTRTAIWLLIELALDLAWVPVGVMVAICTVVRSGVVCPFVGFEGPFVVERGVTVVCFEVCTLFVEVFTEVVFPFVGFDDPFEDEGEVTRTCAEVDDALVSVSCLWLFALEPEPEPKLCEEETWLRVDEGLCDFGILEVVLPSNEATVLLLPVTNLILLP